MRVGRRAAIGTLLLAFVGGLAACGQEAVAPNAPPAAIHGAIVIEPSALLVGDLVTVEITVVTPPDHRVRPVELAESIPPLWLMNADRLAVRRDGGRWVHVTRVRARVREAPGQYAWPAQTVEVEDPSGEATPLELAARPFTVGSVSDLMPDRLEPFGLRAPMPTPTGRPWEAALLGSVATLLTLGGFRLARRLRARRAARAPEADDDATPPWTAAERELAAALAGLEKDARAAADDAAMTLRRYVHRRANRPIETLTTEEIAAQRPPGRLRSRWPRLLELLRRLDALRFPGDLDREDGRIALRETLEDARTFVTDSTPPRELR